MAAADRAFDARPSIRGSATWEKIIMTRLKTIGLLGAALLGASSLAFAQTSTTPTTPMPAPTTSPSANAPSTTMPGSQSARLSEQDVKKKLEGAGYSSVTGIKPNKDGYTAMAMKNGKQVKVDIDNNGKIETMN
jgi:hypothetical protein